MSETFAHIVETGLVAVIRADSADQCVELCRALGAGGVDCWEITMTTPNAFEAIAAVKKELGDQGVVGVGTVLDGTSAASAIHAGAEFVFSPTIVEEAITTAKRYGKVVVPGALTPTEILRAWTLGGDMVKVFPAGHFGPKYFKDLRGPLPQVKLTPTGGVDLSTARSWLEVGAACLGVGSALVDMKLVRAEAWDELSAKARAYRDVVAAYRRETTL